MWYNVCVCVCVSLTVKHSVVPRHNERTVRDESFRAGGSFGLGSRQGGGTRARLKDSRKERAEGATGAARRKSGENIRASERGGGNYRVLVDGCFWRALKDQECIRG